MSRDWARDRGAWTFIAAHYLPRAALLHLLWEAAHVRLYTLWTEAAPREIVFAVVHCTLGDVLISAATLLLALVASGAGMPQDWRWVRVTFLAVLFGAGYTAFSEWMNTVWLETWAYAPAMPTVELLGVELGLSPLAQWAVVPPLALAWAYRTMPERMRSGLHVKRPA